MFLSAAMRIHNFQNNVLLVVYRKTGPEGCRVKAELKSNSEYQFGGDMLDIKRVKKEFLQRYTEAGHPH